MFGVKTTRYARTSRLAKRESANAAIVPPPKIRPTTFVVVQVRQALQQTGTAGPYSAARVVIGAIFTERRWNMVEV